MQLLCICWQMEVLPVVPAPHIREPSIQTHLCFCSSSLMAHILGGRGLWFKPLAPAICLQDLDGVHNSQLWPDPSSTVEETGGVSEGQGALPALLQES